MLNDNDTWHLIWDKYSDTLNDTLFKGYKKQVRARRKDDLQNDPNGLREAVKTEARILADEHVLRIEEKILHIQMGEDVV